MSMTLQRLHNENRYIGAIKLGGAWKFLAGTMAEWYLDYDAYEPDLQFSDEKFTFRNGLTKVDETNAEAFYEAMNPYELSEDDIRVLIAESGEAEEPILMFVVDFDNRTFVNGFYDLAVEDFAPKGWKSYYGNTYEYVPENIRAIWGL